MFINDNQNEAHADDGIMPLALTSGLTIGSSTASGSAEPGGTAYAKSNVTYNVSDTSGWSLRASYASGKTTLSATSGSTIGGANNKQGSALGDNTWGYAWSDDTNPTQSSLYYQTMPAYGSTTTMKTGTANTNTTGSINFAAKFASNAVPGHYTTQVLVSLVATPPLVTYTLTFDKNTTDTVSNLPANQTCQTTDSSCTITISSTTPSRTGYNFKGWSTSSGTSNTVNNAAGSSITMTANKTIYAVWESQNQTFTINFDANGGSGAPAAQSCTTEAGATSCTITLSSTLPTRTNYDFLGWSNTKNTNTTTATASADYSPGKSSFSLSSSSPTTLYAVWRAKVSTSSGFSTITNMQQMTSTICSNAATGATKTLTDTRTGNYTYTVTKLADGKCWMTQNLRLGSTTGTLTLTSSDSNVTSNYTLPQAITSGGFDNTKSGSYYTNQQVYIDSSTLSTKGAYYSHNAATANSIASSSSGTASQDICPKGWRLPTQAEYATLASALGANNNPAGRAIIQGSPNNFVYAGGVSTSGLNYSTTSGYYWSSTISSATYAYYLSFSSTGLTPSDLNSRYSGVSVRCVAK